MKIIIMKLARETEREDKKEGGRAGGGKGLLKHSAAET